MAGWGAGLRRAQEIRYVVAHALHTQGMDAARILAGELIQRFGHGIGGDADVR